MAIQIGKYKRPGIFLEEYDNSVISTPIVDGINNLVMGVSKKGPVNTPVRITTLNDLETIFGQLDRGLERKGSFFHRTVSKMLESSPVYAMNLLLTDDTLDTIEYKSLSSSSNYLNDIERVGPYRRFHDTTGFWKRDTDSFINLTKNNTGYSERAFSLTNLSDRYATVFVFHTQVSGFDRTLIEWYGAAEKVPPYVNLNDWASDYMVDVVIVSGDWSDYKTLAIDSRWSAYFNSTGLRKDQIRNFANDRNVTTLAYYEGLSLIPYFRDGNGRNVFIETTINRDTDKTGIFCAYNNDLVEEDFFNGKLDLVGHTLAGQNVKNIDFLSYQETIMEEVGFTNVPLDLPGNVTALLGSKSTGSTTYVGEPLIDHSFAVNSVPKTSGFVSGTHRTTWFAEDFVYNLGRSSATASALITTSATISVSYHAGSDAYAVISDNYVPITAGTTTLYISAANYATSSTATTYASAIVLDSTGTIKLVNSSSSTPPVVDPTDIVLGKVTFSVQYQAFVTSSTVFTDISVVYGTTGVTKYKHLEPGTDYDITPVGSGIIKVAFNGTADTPDVKNYEQYRKFKIFNRLVDLIDSPNKDKMVMLLSSSTSGTMKKASLSGMTISNIVNTITSNKSFYLNTGLDNSDLSEVLTSGGGFLAFYTIDNEFILGTDGVVTKDEIAAKDSNNNASPIGVVAKYSNLYSKFYDGYINTGDFFYNNRVDIGKLDIGLSYSVTFLPGETPKAISGFNTGVTSSYAGNDYLVFDTDPVLNLNEVIEIRGSVLNTGSFTIVSGLQNSTAFEATGKFIYQVNENTTYEVLSGSTGVTQINDYTHKHYLKSWLDSDGILTTYFLDETFSATQSILTWDAGDTSTDVKSANTFFVQSADANYKETTEIELPVGYVEVENKVLVDNARYTEIVKGDFLEAEYDETLLAIGQVPRKLTRIVNKKQYGTTSLVELTCDAKIKKTFSGAAYQVTRYKKVENYANTYKAISLKGFRVRQASLPDGTEAKQNQILNLVAKGTPMFKALTNKEAIDFRYLVDSFGLGLTDRSKQQLVDICGDRLDAFGFINMPSMKDFKNSSSPSFVNGEGVLQAEFIAKGADPESGPAFLYSFGDGPGTTCVGYFLPYLSVNDNGRPLEMPPASYVATTYMRKHNSNAGGITPWTIAAGVTNGRITNINGLEIDFTPSDIEWLNGAQMNPIVFKRNRGNVIETENTAQTLYKSALSYIHVREVLIELERELSRMLLDFQWKFNTADIRAEVKLRADVICETYVSKSGLYNYFNKMDEENNTNEIIDNQIGVLDTYVEPIKGMGIIVNNVTILRTGAIAAGGFQ
jgi:hypothetical protein